MLVFANGPEFGGGLPIAPGAAIDDGRLDAVLVADTPWWRRLWLFLRLQQAQHERSREVTRVSASSFTLRFDAPPAYERDGEWHRASSPEIVVDVLPRALELIVP